MHRFLLPSVACPALTCFSTLSQKRHDFEEKFIVNTKCVVILCTSFLWNISHCRKNWARRHHKRKQFFMSSSHYSYQILKKCELSLQIFEKYSKYQISWKSVQCEPSCCMRTDGRTVMTTHSRSSQLCKYHVIISASLWQFWWARYFLNFKIMLQIS